jgi:hypothetical protein
MKATSSTDAILKFYELLLRPEQTAFVNLVAAHALAEYQQYMLARIASAPDDKDAKKRPSTHSIESLGQLSPAAFAVAVVESFPLNWRRLTPNILGVASDGVGRDWVLFRTTLAMREPPPDRDDLVVLSEEEFAAIGEPTEHDPWPPDIQEVRLVDGGWKLWSLPQHEIPAFGLSSWYAFE